MGTWSDGIYMIAGEGRTSRNAWPGSWKVVEREQAMPFGEASGVLTFSMKSIEEALNDIRKTMRQMGESIGHLIVEGVKTRDQMVAERKEYERKQEVLRAGIMRKTATIRRHQQRFRGICNEQHHAKR